MQDELQGIIESVLFAAGDAVKIDKLAEIAGVNAAMVKSAVEHLSASYAEQGRGLCLIEIDEGYQLCTRPEYYTYVQAIAQIRRLQGLSNAALEVLSIVAYNQPVPKSTVEYVRGVDSDWAVRRLAERGLIQESGRLDAPGKPILYVTTQEFLRCFGLKSLADLPDMNIDIPENEPDQIQLDV